ncbi:MAG: hypothetical protein K0Q51_176 [Rickettsiaceae bacterium]|jgi:diadenosine tetraphosphate (Ap4A) HIT family hydrolase|nr:hypothetical protein [Rickettsiaceae bacterium]
MSNDFVLDPRLQSDGVILMDLELSRLILVDNSYFPWLILVPRRENLKEIIDLNQKERIVLMEEISLTSEVMQKIFCPDKLNIAALGNIVSQLHIHIVARFTNDKAYPHPVFGREKKPYELEKQEELIKIISNALKNRIG